MADSGSYCQNNLGLVWVGIENPQKLTKNRCFKVSKSSIAVDWWIDVWYRVRTHGTRSTYYTRSKSRGQRSRSRRNITYQQEKALISQEHVGDRVQTWCKPSQSVTQHVTAVQCHIEIAVTPPLIPRFRSNLVQSLNTAQPIHYKCLRSKVTVTL